jgi:hypothetical protein
MYFSHPLIDFASGSADAKSPPWRVHSADLAVELSQLSLFVDSGSPSGRIEFSMSVVWISVLVRRGKRAPRCALRSIHPLPQSTLLRCDLLVGFFSAGNFLIPVSLKPAAICFQCSLCLSRTGNPVLPVVIPLYLEAHVHKPPIRQARVLPANGIAIQAHGPSSPDRDAGRDCASAKSAMTGRDAQIGSPSEVAPVAARRGFGAIVFFADSATRFAFAASVGFGVGVSDSGEASAALIRKSKSAITASAQRHLDTADGRTHDIAPI